VVARGRRFSDGELTAAIDGPVSELVRDDAGKQEVEELLMGFSATGFEQESVGRILSHDRIPEDWRVGEALAECILRDHCACFFPWPSGRDQRNPDSSPTGADLVGFQETDRKDSPHRFAFGEVKTSSEQNWPPQVMYSRHGMIRQLESLRDDLAVRDHLVKYLCHRANGSNWVGQYMEAAVRYLAEPADVALYGFLVRDVEPKDADLRSRAKTLATHCPGQMGIELTAVYFPAASIDGLGHRVNLEREGLGDGN